MEAIKLGMVWMFCSLVMLSMGGRNRMSVVAAPDCNSAIVAVRDCLRFVTGQTTSPSAECCSGVEDLHRNNPVCLCELAEDNTSAGEIPNYQPELAEQLPTLCKIPGASVSECPALLGQNSSSSTPNPSGDEAEGPARFAQKNAGCRNGMFGSRESSWLCTGIVGWIIGRDHYSPLLLV